MSTFSDPNREAIGQPPIWTGAGADETPPPVEEAGPYDPGAYTVAEVLEYVETHPDYRETVAAAERAGKARSTLLDALEDDSA